MAVEVTVGVETVQPEEVAEEVAEEVVEEIAEEVAEEVTPAPDVEEDTGPPAPVVECESYLHPDDPCFYCKCADDGSVNCFPLMTGTSCPADDCCSLNAACEPCPDDPDFPCPISGKYCKGSPIFSCDDHNSCTENTATCYDGVCACDSVDLSDGEECDADPDFCTLGDTCLGGVCVAGIPQETEDGNPCTVGVCLKGLVAQLPIEGPCTDGEPCTENDYCELGECVPGPPVECALAPCDASATCNPQTGACVTVSKPNGAPCNPGGGDGCGTCYGIQCVSTGESCEDNNACTDDLCNAEGNCEYIPNDYPCDDGDPCTISDHCEAGSCKSGPLDDCEDGNPCTTDTCAPPEEDDGGGGMMGGMMGGGDDGGGGGMMGGGGGGMMGGEDEGVQEGNCLHETNEEPCDDQNACTTGDVCGPEEIPCPGPFGAKIDLHHVLDSAGLKTVRYSKDFNTCGHIVNQLGQKIHAGEPFCTTGECVDVVLPSASINAFLGDTVRFCYANDYEYCSDFVDIELPSPNAACQGDDTSDDDCDDADICTDDSCDPIWGCQHITNEVCKEIKTSSVDATTTMPVSTGPDCDGEMVAHHCAPGLVASGFQGNGNLSIEKLELKCRLLLGDGSLSDDSVETQPIGQAQGGDAFGPYECPDDQVMIGSNTNASDLIYGVRGRCQYATAVVEGEASYQALTSPAGGNAGIDIGQPCPAGYVVTGVQAPVSDTLCALQWHCTKLVKE